ncbi:vacuolar fusion MON1 homolog B-like isoform X2 [Pelobates cultripes]|uniref:Vacuolar fusion protein MON1 homolog n=1 Tax=Pelobates cultripes TaxID=61616 RepID=A0AAD1WQI9_PELCU|nr:vacuolar fusion MON1 homolog B-like isoform X2 [Pelobates cultripes]
MDDQNTGLADLKDATSEDTDKDAVKDQERPSCSAVFYPSDETPEQKTDVSIYPCDESAQSGSHDFVLGDDVPESLKALNINVDVARLIPDSWVEKTFCDHSESPRSPEQVVRTEVAPVLSDYGDHTPSVTAPEDRLQQKLWENTQRKPFNVISGADTLCANSGYNVDDEAIKSIEKTTQGVSADGDLKEGHSTFPLDLNLELKSTGLSDEKYDDGSSKLSDSTDYTLEDCGDFPSLPSVVVNVPSEMSPAQIQRDEDITADGWRARRKHVFVLSEAGKPIYSRYGNEEALSSTMGVMMALVSFVQSGNNSIRSIYSDNQKVVFLQQGPLVLVSVSRAPQTEEQLRRELQYVYYQIISMLTQASVARIFERKKNYDLRRLLAGSEKILDSLLDLLDSDPGFLLGAVRCVALPCPLRDSLSSILTKSITPNLVFSILVAEQQLVTVVQERAVIEDCRLDPTDLHLLLNLIGASSAFQAGEIWTPICLPRFNPDGYFYAYISYLDPECTVCLVLLSTDKESFYAVSGCKKKIQLAMEAQNSLSALSTAMRSSVYSVTSLGVPELLHFVYKPMDVPDAYRQLPQFTSPLADGPYSSESERQRLFDLYRYLHCRIHNSARPLRLIYHVAEKETLLAWVTSKFELYTAFSSLVTKVGAINVITKLLRWIKKEEDRLFIRYPPKYSTTPLPGRAQRADRTERFQNGFLTGV